MWPGSASQISSNVSWHSKNCLALNWSMPLISPSSGGSEQLAVRVEALAALAAQLAGDDHALEEGWRRVLGLVELFQQHQGDVIDGVQSDEIREHQRPHGQTAAVLHAIVDVLAR